MAVDPSGRFAYVANEGSNDVSAYTINSSTGALTAISCSTCSTGTAPTVTVDPSGQFVYVTNIGSGSPPTPSISAYTINTSTGVLTAISGSPFPAGGAHTSPTSVTVDPTGQFVYVASVSTVGESGNISAFTINPNTGALAAVTGSPFTNGVNSPSSVAMDPSGLFAYVGNQNTINSMWLMSSFKIDATTGALTLLSLSPNLGAGTGGVATDPLGQFVYATQPYPTNALVALSISYTTFHFTLLNSDVCIPQEDPASITVDPSGKFVYVTNADSTANNITACAMDAITADLSNISGESAVATGTTPVSVVTTGTIHQRCDGFLQY